MTAIGSLNEKPLHAALKEWYRRDGDFVEVPVEGFVIDLVRGDLLIEIQTRGFSGMQRKLDRLLDDHPMRLVHPVAAVRWIVKADAETGEVTPRRRSPKRGIAADVCAELVSFPSLLSHPHFTLEVLLVEEEELWRSDRKGWRRRGFVVEERRLIEVFDRVRFGSPADLCSLLPDGLPDPFTTADLAGRLGRSRHLAQEVAYCLRESEAIEAVGRDRRGYLYRRP